MEAVIFGIKENTKGLKKPSNSLKVNKSIVIVKNNTAAAYTNSKTNIIFKRLFIAYYYFLIVFTNPIAFLVKPVHV